MVIFVEQSRFIFFIFISVKKSLFLEWFSLMLQEDEILSWEEEEGNLSLDNQKERGSF